MPYDMFSYIIWGNDMSRQIRPIRLRGLPVDLRAQIKNARKRRGWSQRELAAKIGLPQPHISGIESGHIVPRFNTLLDFVRVLDQDILLVPRALVPAVQSLVRAQQEPQSIEKSLYAVDNDESFREAKSNDEF